MAAVEAPKMKTALELPTVPSQFEACPDFPPKSNTAGKWSMNANPGKFGVSFFPMYEGKPVPITHWSVLFGSFDFNEYEGKDTYSCKLSSTAILISSLPQKAKETVISSLAQLKADQLVFKDVIAKFVKARPDIVPVKLDEDTNKPIELRTLGIVRLKNPKVDPKKKDKEMTPFWQVSSVLPTDRNEKDVRKQKITIPVIINGKALVNPTRGSLCDAIKGKRFLKITTGTLSAFRGEKETVLQVRSSVERLQELRGTGEVTVEEMSKIISSTVDMFAGLGIETGEVEQHAAADDPSAPDPVSSNDGLTDQGFGDFKEVESTGSKKN
jgi:hypothetical protein